MGWVCGRKIETVYLGVICEMAGKKSENMRVKAEVDAGEARMEKVWFDWEWFTLKWLRRFAGNPVPGLFAGATQETPSVDEKLTKKRSVHNSTSHALDWECKEFRELPILEKEKLVDEHKLCLFVRCRAIGWTNAMLRMDAKFRAALCVTLL